jgi:hypothetical protein
MVAVALCALFLSPVVWLFRRNEALMRAERMAADRARAQAELALAQAVSAQTGLTRTKAATARQPNLGSLWAALGVNHPVIRAGQTKDLRIECTLVNDGANAIDPKIAESRIIINGKELAHSGEIVCSGLTGAQPKALAPRNNLQFGLLLGDHFKEPGIYRVSWKGAGFQSPEIVFRILPPEEGR